MAKKKTTKKVQGMTKSSLHDLLINEVIPAYMAAVLTNVKTCMERAISGYAWYSNIDGEDGGVKGYWHHLTLDVSGRKKCGIGGDVHLGCSIEVSFFDELRLSHLFELLQEGPEALRHAGDFPLYVGKVLVEATKFETEVNVSMTKRNAAEATSHALRYLALAQLGLQIENVVREQLYPSFAASFILESWNAAVSRND